MLPHSVQDRSRNLLFGELTILQVDMQETTKESDVGEGIKALEKKIFILM